eukprot:12293286-Heterocapsa_arctica.AAC.1
MRAADHDATRQEREAAAAEAERASTRPGGDKAYGGKRAKTRKPRGTADCPIDLDPPAGKVRKCRSGKLVRLAPFQG